MHYVGSMSIKTLTDIQQSLSRQMIKRVLIVVLGVLVAIMITADWRSYWRAQSQIESLKTPPPQQEQVYSQAQLDPGLFGSGLSTSNVAITSQSVALDGVLVQSNVSQSSAIIRCNNQSAKIYHVGDTLPFGAKIQAITTEGVLLQYNDHQEKLPLTRHIPEEKKQDPLL
jgi:type II secretory pathway component PulC